MLPTCNIVCVLRGLIEQGGGTLVKEGLTNGDILVSTRDGAGVTHLLWIKANQKSPEVMAELDRINNRFGTGEFRKGAI
jgi:hypothetical protein